MKLFTSALLVASSFLVSSCISCTHRSVGGTVTTTETADMPEMPKARLFNDDEGDVVKGLPNYR